MTKREDFLIYLVDDDQMFLRSLEHVLQQKLKYNIRIQTFSTGEECLAGLEGKPSIIVLDYMLNASYPRAMDGLEVLNRIRKELPSATVIMLSGQDNMEVAVNTIKYGAYDYVVKTENAVLKIQNLVKNILQALSMKKEVKTYKFYMATLLGLIGIVFFAAILIEVFFRDILH